MFDISRRLSVFPPMETQQQGVAHLLEYEIIYSYGTVQQERWKENIKERLGRRQTHPQRNRVAELTHVQLHVQNSQRYAWNTQPSHPPKRFAFVIQLRRCKNSLTVLAVEINSQHHFTGLTGVIPPHGVSDSHPNATRGTAEPIKEPTSKQHEKRIVLPWCHRRQHHTDRGKQNRIVSCLWHRAKLVQVYTTPSVSQ